MFATNEHEQRKIDDFLSLISPWEAAYREATFSFIAVRDGGKLVLAQGHVILPTTAVPPTLEVYGRSLCGCAVRMSTLAVDSKSLIEALLGEGLQTPVGLLTLAEVTNGDKSVSARFDKYPSDFNSSREHVLSLSLGFAQHAFLGREAEFCNDLRLANVPYESVNELANELWLRPFRWDLCTLDFSAHSVVAVDLAREISNGIANLGLIVAYGVDLEPACLGFRVISKGVVVQRRTVVATEFAWVDTERFRVGEVKVPVPDDSVIQCFASYGERTLHQGWVVHPGSVPNVRRMTHEVFDAGLENTRKCLFDSKTLKQDGRNLEAGVANILYMLGFAVNPLSGKPLSENPDVVAMAPSGDLVVVECTTAGIDIEGKLSKLLARTAALRARLTQSGHSHLRCMPVIVSSLSRASITDTQSAKEAGILVMASEDLEAALARTMVPQNADQIFAEKWLELHPPQDAIANMLAV